MFHLFLQRIVDLEKKVARVSAEVKSTPQDNRRAIQEMEDNLRAVAVHMKLDDISSILLGMLQLYLR